MNDLPFSFLKSNPRPPKPRTRGLTEIRGAYYAPVGPRYLQDVFELAAPYVDSLKFAGGAFTLVPRAVLTQIIDLCHANQVAVSTGGFVEYVLTQGPAAVDRYVDTCKELGFDTIELSAGFITLGTDDLLRLIERVRRAGLKAKPELGIQFGAGGASSAESLKSEGTRDVQFLIHQARRFIDAGAELIMVESEGITESVTKWRTDVPAALIAALGPEPLMFEAADPAVFTWYVHNYGPDVNLFVDHSQILQLECLRAGIWGTSKTWGRIQTYRP